MTEGLTEEKVYETAKWTDVNAKMENPKKYSHGASGT